MFKEEIVCCYMFLKIYLWKNVSERIFLRMSLKQMLHIGSADISKCLVLYWSLQL